MIIVSGFEKRAHFTQKMNFELVVLRKTALHDLPVALFLASLASSVVEICVLKLQECTESDFEKNVIKRYSGFQFRSNNWDMRIP